MMCMGVEMDIQKEREAFELTLKQIGKVDDSNFEVADDGSYEWDAIHFAWTIWQAAKDQTVQEVITIGNELQSWVAVNSFSADDGEGVLPVVDANAIAEKIEELTGAKS